MISTLEPPHPVETRVRFSVEQYDRMFEDGILDEGDSVELIYGEIQHKGRWRNDGCVRYRFSLDQYHRMIEAGILREDDPVEFYDGEVKPIMPQGAPHSTCLEILSRLFSRLLHEAIAVRCQLPITIGGDEPEPDLAICNAPEERLNRHPGTDDIHIVIEVAESSLSVDRGPKLAVFASHKLKEYWIVNLVEEVVEVFSKPDAARKRYRVKTRYARGSEVPLHIEGNDVIRIAVDSMLPKAK